jgi:hypothetical protein
MPIMLDHAFRRVLRAGRRAVMPRTTTRNEQLSLLDA